MKAAEVFESTTTRIVEAIEAGAERWEMPWSRPGLAFPTNPTTGKHYRGGNVLTLLGMALERDYPAAEWATYKQWASIGAQVRRGEHGTGCIWWSVKTPTMTVEDEQTGEDVELVGHSRYFAKAFTVFNAGQVDGYTPRLAERDTPEQIDAAEAFFAAVGARVEHRYAGRACYVPAEDLIVLPPFEMFTSSHGYYATTAHEHAHWTGHADRLARDLSGRFGTDAYAVEELVAELSAAFTCALLGISPTPRPDHAAYLASWLEVLKADPKALYSIASKAQAATDYLTSLTG